MWNVVFDGPYNQRNPLQHDSALVSIVSAYPIDWYAVPSFWSSLASALLLLAVPLSVFEPLHWAVANAKLKSEPFIVNWHVNLEPADGWTALYIT